MVDNDKREWQKKIPEFTTKFVHDDDLEVGIEIYGPKEFVAVYESYFHTDIQKTIENILKEKEKHI